MKLPIKVLKTSGKQLLIDTTQMLCSGHLPEDVLMSFLMI